MIHETGKQKKLVIYPHDGAGALLTASFVDCVAHVQAQGSFDSVVVGTLQYLHFVVGEQHRWNLDCWLAASAIRFPQQAVGSLG